MIWCVEDDPSIREIVVYALRSTGLEAYGFEDGNVFWEALQERSPDLVLLDSRSNVLSINPAAKALFGADDDCIGRNFCTVDRKQDMSAAVESAFQNGRHEVRAWRNSREYQFCLSRIESQEKNHWSGDPGLRHYRCPQRRAQPPGVFRQCVP